jgi:hypothetical protein
MRAWFLFAILGFLVFGVPLIDELYRIRVRRQTDRLPATTDDAVSLVPDMGEYASTSSLASAHAVKTLENP